jgi:serine/threonine protein kinase
VTPPHDGEVLGGRYLLGDLLGRGGAADVFRATDQLLERTVAVKVLRDQAAGGPDALGDGTDAARFAGEVRTLAGLNHRGLVTVLDAGTAGGRAFLVMELVDGPTLHALVARQALTSDRSLDLGAQVADALSYVHGRGVLHRDVKPGNILLDSRGRARLADFGIARLVDEESHHTRTGQTIGTAAYLAPEQVLGEDLTSAVDVYSLGLVLLEALTGRRTFPGTPTEAALARLNRSPEVPTSLPAPWPTLLTAMTARERGLRPSAADVAVELRDVRRRAEVGAADDVGARTVAMAPPTRRAPVADRTPAALAPRSPLAPVPSRRATTTVSGIVLLVVAAVLTTVTRAPASQPAVAESSTTTPTGPSSAPPSPAVADPVAERATTSVTPSASSPTSAASGTGGQGQARSKKAHRPKHGKPPKAGKHAKPGHGGKGHGKHP